MELSSFWVCGLGLAPNEAGVFSAFWEYLRIKILAPVHLLMLLKGDSFPVLKSGQFMFAAI